MTERDNIRIYDDIQSLSRAAAGLVLERALEAVAARGWFSVALAGGGTPRTLYESLSASPYLYVMPWPSIFVFWGDERCVPPDSPESNYAMVRDALLERVPLPLENVFRMKGEVRPRSSAALEYETTLRGLFPQAGFPRFDLVLLGIGTDGHVASLFPGSPALEERERWVIETEAPSGYSTRDRLTLSLPLINSARTVIVIAAGENKRPVLKMVFDAPSPGDKNLPATLVNPREGELIWLLDRSAAPN